MPERLTRRMTIQPREAAALHRLLDAYLATDSGDPGLSDLAAFYSRLGHAQMDHAAYESADTPTCVCPTDDYCPKCHPRWHSAWVARTTPPSPTPNADESGARA